MQTIHDRILSLMAYKRWNNTRLASALNLSPASVTLFFQRRTSPKFDTIQSLLRAMPELSAAWLITGEGNMLADPQSDNVDLPIVGEIAAGNPIEFVDPPDLTYLSYSRKILGNPANYLLMRVQGDSMQPAICHNDVVLLRTNFIADDLDKSIVAVRVDTEITLKLLINCCSPPSSILMPINHHYEPIVLNEYSPPAQIIGYLVSLHRQFTM